MFERIKAILSDDTVFYGLLILLIGVASFGLGRWSVSGSDASAQPAAVIMSEGESRPQTEQAGMDAAPADNVPEAAVSGQFVGSRNSDKYHLPWCPGAQRIKEENKVWFESEADAAAAGYVPAANCPGL